MRTKTAPAFNPDISAYRSDLDQTVQLIKQRNTPRPTPLWSKMDAARKDRSAAIFIVGFGVLMLLLEMAVMFTTPDSHFFYPGEDSYNTESLAFLALPLFPIGVGLFHLIPALVTLARGGVQRIIASATGAILTLGFFALIVGIFTTYLASL